MRLAPDASKTEGREECSSFFEIAKRIVLTPCFSYFGSAQATDESIDVSVVSGCLVLVIATASEGLCDRANLYFFNLRLYELQW